MISVRSLQSSEGDAYILDLNHRRVDLAMSVCQITSLVDLAMSVCLYDRCDLENY